MREAFFWLEHSALGELMRTSSLWTYPIVNLFHIFGIAALFGAVTIIDLRLLGVWRSIPLAAVRRCHGSVWREVFYFGDLRCGASGTIHPIHRKPFLCSNRRDRGGTTRSCS